MNLSGLIIRAEAMEQFKTAWRKIYNPDPKNWERILRERLQNVKEMGTPSMIPLMVPDTKPRYFKDHSGWLFITSGTGQNSLPITLRGVGRTKECFFKKRSYGG